MTRSDKSRINNTINMPMPGRDGWMIEFEVVGALGEENKHKYKYGDATVHRYPLKSKLAIKFSELHAMNRDMGTVLDYLDQLSKLRAIDPDPRTDEGYNNIVLMNSLFLSAVVTYYRGFNEGRGRKTRLDPRELFADSSKLNDIHYGIRQYRNNYAAHWGDPRNDFLMFHQPVMLIAEKEANEISYNFWSEIQTPLFSMIDEFKELVQYVINWLENQLVRHDRMLLDELEVIEIRHEKVINVICEKTRVSINDAKKLLKLVQGKYPEAGRSFALFHTDRAEVHFLSDSKMIPGEDQMLLICKLIKNKWVLDEIAVVITTK